MLSSADVRRSLVERVSSRLAGQGISRAEVEATIVRVRRDLDRAGVVIEGMGIGAAGHHTVMMRIATSARDAIQRLADRSGFFLSFLDLADA
ncbi:MAG TPA: hypothetical protein VF488_00460 [Gemmatimonadaceae bacterium]